MPISRFGGTSVPTQDKESLSSTRNWSGASFRRNIASICICDGGLDTVGIISILQGLICNLFSPRFVLRGNAHNLPVELCGEMRVSFLSEPKRDSMAREPPTGKGATFRLARRVKSSPTGILPALQYLGGRNTRRLAKFCCYVASASTEEEGVAIPFKCIRSRSK